MSTPIRRSPWLVYDHGEVAAAWCTERNVVWVCHDELSQFFDLPSPYNYRIRLHATQEYPGKDCVLLTGLPIHGYATVNKGTEVFRLFYRARQALEAWPGRWCYVWVEIST